MASRYRPLRSRSGPAGRSQVFVEPIERALPGELGGRVVVTRRRVVVEAVIGTLVDIAFVGDVGGRQGGIEGRPSRGDAGVEFAVMRKQRRFDLGGFLGVGLA